MKRLLLAFASVVLFGSGASADYINPPGWNDNPYFTHQSWSFTEDGSPAAADEGYINPYGEPSAERFEGVWQDDLGWQYDLDDGSPIRQRQGGWYFEGPMTEVVIAEIDIPNVPNPELRKELWFQTTLKTNSESPQILMQAFDNAGNEFDLAHTPDVDFLGYDPVDDGIWAVATFVYSIFPQPAAEKVRIEAVSLLPEDPDLQLPAEFFVIDQIDIDTRCVPEASVVVMILGMALLGLITVVWRCWQAA